MTDYPMTDLQSKTIVWREKMRLTDLVESIWRWPDVGPWIHQRFDTYNDFADFIPAFGNFGNIFTSLRTKGAQS